MKCPTCGSTSRDIGLTPQQYVYNTAKVFGLDEWVNSQNGTERDGLTLVGKQTDYDFDYDSNPLWIVFQFEGQFFKISGYSNSYGDRNWSGYAEVVQARVESVTFWE